MEYSIYTDPPEDFSSQIEASGCYMEWDNKILFLKRHPERPQGDTWGVPGGKIEREETPLEAVIREVREEVGINIQNQKIEEAGKLFVRLPHLDYIFHMFCTLFKEQPKVDLELTEHVELRWLSISEAIELPLIKGGKEALEYFIRYRKKARI